MPDIDIKQKRKQNISDEERERRRQRMVALREKLSKASEPIPKKDPKAAIKAKREEFVKQEAEKIRKQEAAKKAQLPPSDEGNEHLPTAQAAQPPPKNPSKKKPTKVAESSDSEQEQDDIAYKKARKNVKRKPPVKKAIKIKYYSDVSPEEMENDAKFLQGLHTVDKAYEAPKKEAPKDDKMERMLKEMGY